MGLQDYNIYHVNYYTFDEMYNIVGGWVTESFINATDGINVTNNSIITLVMDCLASCVKQTAYVCWPWTFVSAK